MENVFVGIDVSKDRLDVAVRPSGDSFMVERNDSGLEALVRRLKALAPHLVVLEATGGFETVVAAALGAAGLPFVIANPAQIRAFAKALGKRAKLVPAKAGNRSDRCGGDRPFRRGDPPRPAPAAGRSQPAARRSDRKASAGLSPRRRGSLP